MALNLLLEAREIVRTNPLTPKTVAIRNAADDLALAYSTLREALTRATISDFIAHATRLLLAINRFHAGDDPPPREGAGEVYHGDSGDEQPLARAGGVT